MTSTDPRRDRHRNPSLGGVRPPRELQERTVSTLDSHGWNLSEFVTACMELVNRSPGPMLAQLRDVRPTARRGRPPKKQT